MPVSYFLSVTGMRPLLYSEYDAHNRHIGWTRTGHHISYSRNVMHLHCPLLLRGVAFYELEWQMVRVDLNLDVIKCSKCMAGSM